MKTVTLPVSDCGCFVAGKIGPESFNAPPGERAYPEFGVIIWYETKEAAKAACAAAVGAHWPEPAHVPPEREQGDSK